MDDLVNAGYYARKHGDEAEEIRLFNTWCQKEAVAKENMQAEIGWEKRLSQLKWQAADSLGWNDF